MKRVATAVVLIPLVLAAVLWLPPWMFSIAAGIVALIAADEFIRIAQANNVWPSRWATMVGVALCFVAFLLRGRDAAIGPAYVRICGGLFFATWQHPHAMMALLLFTALAALVTGMFRDELATVLPGAATSAFTVVYLGFTLSSLAWIKDLQFGPFLLLYLFVVVWSGDIFAYYIGRAIGRHKMAPRVSPKKTWEGAAASLVASVLLGTLFFHAAPTVTAWMARVGVLAQTSGEPLALGRVVGLSAWLNIV